MKYEIKEGTEGTWNYHLAEEGETKALCGGRVMPCGTERWGAHSSSVESTYCEECEEKART